MKNRRGHAGGLAAGCTGRPATRSPALPSRSTSFSTLSSSGCAGIFERGEGTCNCTQSSIFIFHRCPRTGPPTPSKTQYRRQDRRRYLRLFSYPSLPARGHPYRLEIRRLFGESSCLARICPFAKSRRVFQPFSSRRVSLRLISRLSRKSRAAAPPQTRATLENLAHFHTYRGPRAGDPTGSKNTGGAGGPGLCAARFARRTGDKIAGVTQSAGLASPPVQFPRAGTATGGIGFHAPPGL